LKKLKYWLFWLKTDLILAWNRRYLTREQRAWLKQERINFNKKLLNKGYSFEK